MNVAVWTDDSHKGAAAMRLVQEAGHIPSRLAATRDKPRAMAPDTNMLFCSLPDACAGLLEPALERMEAIIPRDLPVLIAVDSLHLGDIQHLFGGPLRDFVLHGAEPREVSLRIAALQRKSELASLSFGHFEFAELGHNVLVDHLAVRLNPSQFQVALHLFRNAGRCVARTDLHELIARRAITNGRSVDVAVSRIRSKLKLGEANRVEIYAVRGRGYRLDWL